MCSVTTKIGPEAQNMKAGHDTLDTAKNESERDRTPSVQPKMSWGAQNMETGLDVLGSDENRSESAKHESETRRPWYL
jgi:hypothetical protein